MNVTNAHSNRSSKSSDASALLSPAGHSIDKSETSLSDGSPDRAFEPSKMKPRQSLSFYLQQLFEENIVAKPLQVGTRGLQTIHYSDHTARIPWGYPEIVSHRGPDQGLYDLREIQFWTCGFFPGTLYALLERATRYPKAFSLGEHTKLAHVRMQLKSLCEAWKEPIHAMAARTDTHDIGFIIMPALRRDWELNGNQRSLDSITRAAYSLSKRYNPEAKVIRSWDILIKKDIVVTNMDENFLVIIDSLCNLDLLFYASAQNGDIHLANIATAHARKLLDSHLRLEKVTSFTNQCYYGQLYSTCHVANIDPRDGALQWRWTAQGYSNESTWARGQAWAILGYAQTYMWTKDPIFLEASCGVAEYFLYRLETAPSSVEVRAQTSIKDDESTTGRYVPLWDFDAPIDPENPLRDSSASMIAANGMLILSQALQGNGQHKLSLHFIDTAIKIMHETIDLCLSEEKMQFVKSTGGVEVEDAFPGQTFEGLLKHGTANNNKNSRRRYADHGLVYADYYLVEFGNRLLSMGLM